MARACRGRGAEGRASRSPSDLADAKNLGRGPASSLQRREQRLSGECEGKDEVSDPAGKPAPVEGEAVEQRPGDEEQHASTAKAGAT